MHLHVVSLFKKIVFDICLVISDSDVRHGLLAGWRSKRVIVKFCAVVYVNWTPVTFQRLYSYNRLSSCLFLTLCLCNFIHNAHTIEFFLERYVLWFSNHKQLRQMWDNSKNTRHCSRIVVLAISVKLSLKSQQCDRVSTLKCLFGTDECLCSNTFSPHITALKMQSMKFVLQTVPV